MSSLSTSSAKDHAGSPGNQIGCKPRDPFFGTMHNIYLIYLLSGLLALLVLTIVLMLPSDLKWTEERWRYRRQIIQVIANDGVRR